ncbi:MAG: transposase [Verrucomicrobia bacterium]|nr:transposase [Verrucomicrobiota bacterium]
MCDTEVMYVAEIPNRTSPPAILLRESFREDGKVKNRTLANLSSWPTCRIDALRRLLRGEFDQLSAPEPTCGPVFGLLYALHQVAASLGVAGALGQKRLGKLALFLVLARVAHQGSRLSAVRWARDHAVAEVLGLAGFDEDDLYAALDDLCARQEKIEQALWRNYLTRRATPPALFLYDVTSSYLEGEHNALGAFGYNRDGKRGKFQIVIGLLADQAGEPLAVRVFAGNTADPSTVSKQIEILKQQFSIADVIFVGDRGMLKSAGKKALGEADFHYISALTDPQIRLLLAKKTGVRYILRKNPDEARRIRHRLEDKLSKLRSKIAERNELVEPSARRKPEAGLATLKLWLARHKLTGLVSLRLEQRRIVETIDPQAELRSSELAGCYVIVTDLAKEKLSPQAVHDSYMALQKVERDFRTMKTGLLEIRPLFVRKESRTRGHVFCCLLALKLQREVERRLAGAFGTTEQDPQAVTVPDALAALGRLLLLSYEIDAKTTLTRLPKPDQHQRRILDALKVSLPAK